MTQRRDHLDFDVDCLVLRGVKSNVENQELVRESVEACKGRSTTVTSV